MPLVTSRNVYGDNGGGHYGPFQRGNDDLYVFTVSGTSTIVPSVSTDDGATWSDGTGEAFSDTVFAFWAEYDASADVFHCAAHIQGGTVYYVAYHPATDVWGTQETVNSHSNWNVPGFGVSLAVDAGGDVWIMYQGDHEDVGGSNYRRIELAHRTAANTFTKYDADDGGTNYWTTGQIRFDSDGLLHLLYGTWQTRPWYRTFDPSTETFGTAVDLMGSNASFAVNCARRLAYYETTGGVQRMTASYRGASGYPSSNTIDDGTPGSNTVITSSALAVWDGDNSSALMLVEDAETETVYAIFADSSTGDVWLDSNVSDAGWGTDTELADGVAVRWLDANVYVNSNGELVLGVIYDESGVGVTYLEHYLRDASVGVELDAAIAGTSDATAELNADRAAQATIAATGDAAAALNVTRAASVTITGTGTAAAALLVNSTHHLTATITTSGDVTASLVVGVVRPLAAQVDGTSGAAAALLASGDRALEATIAGRTTLRAELYDPTRQSLSYRVSIDWDGDGFAVADALDDPRSGVREVQCIGRGMADHVSQVAAVGMCLVTVNNLDGRWNPNNAASPYYGKLRPNVPVRVDVTDGVAAWTVFTGYVRRVSLTAREVGDHAAVLYCEDAIGLLQAHRLSLPLQENKRGDELLRLIAAAAFRGEAASGLVRFSGQPADGDSVTIAGTPYTFRNTLTSPFQVKIGATYRDTKDNLVAGVNTGEGEGTAYGTGTKKNTLVTALSASDTQEQLSHDFNTLTFLGTYHAAGEDWMYAHAQGFVPEITGVPTQITLNFYTANYIGTPGDVAWQICQDDNGEPGTVLVGGTFTPASGVNTIPVSTGAYLTAGERYWLIVKLVSYPTGTSGVHAIHVSEDDATIYPQGPRLWGSTGGASWNGAANDRKLTFSVSLEGDVELTAVSRGAWGNSLTLAESSAAITISGPKLTGGTDGDVTLLLDTGDMQHDMAADLWSEERTSALDAVSDVVESEGTSFVWADEDGALVYHEKGWWFRLPTQAADLSVDGVPIDLSNAMDILDVTNEVTVTYRPRYTKTPGVIARANGVLEIPVTTRDPRWNTTKDLPEGGSHVVRLPFVDQATGQMIGATDVITPTPGIDFTVWESIGGRDYTDMGLISASVAVTGSGVEVTFINHGGTPFYLTDFQVRGTAIVSYEPQQAVRQDTASIAAYGKRGKSVSLPLYSSQAFSESYAAYLLNQFSEPRLRIREVLWGARWHIGNRSLYSCRIGDVVAVTNSELGMENERYLIVGMRFSLAPGGTFNLAWTVRPIEELAYWTLGDAAYSLLGATTRLSL